MQETALQGRTDDTWWKDQQPAPAAFQDCLHTDRSTDPWGGYQHGGSTASWGTSIRPGGDVPSRWTCVCGESNNASSIAICKSCKSPWYECQVFPQRRRGKNPWNPALGQGTGKGKGPGKGTAKGEPEDTNATVSPAVQKLAEARRALFDAQKSIGKDPAEEDKQMLAAMQARADRLQDKLNAERGAEKSVEVCQTSLDEAKKKLEGFIIRQDREVCG